MKKTFFVFLILGLFLSPLWLIGEVDPAPKAKITGSLAAPPISLEGAQQLSLDEATRIAVAQSLDLDFLRIDRESKQHDIPIAKSVYDTTLGINGAYSHDREERASVILGTTEINGSVEASLEKKIPLGTTVKATLQGARHSNNSSFNTLPRNYTGFLRFDVEQPLLKNFFGYIDRAEIKKVVINTKKFDYETLGNLEEGIAKIRAQYWDLVFSYQNLLDRQEDLKKAQEFLQITIDKMELGLTEKPDRYAAEANVRQRVIGVFQAKTQLRAASYALKVMLRAPEIELILPNDTPEFRELHLDYDTELQHALRNRRDLKAKVLALEEQRIEAKIKSNERLPDLDFVGSMAGTALDRKLSASQGKIWDYDHPQYTAEVRFAWDIENRESRYEYKQARLEYVKRAKELEQLKLEVGQQLDDSIQELMLATERVRQTREIKILQTKKLEEEERNFNLGRSESKTIIDFQEDVILAQTEATRALVDFAKALDGYYNSGDRLLDEVGITEAQILERASVEGQTK